MTKASAVRVKHVVGKERWLTSPQQCGELEPVNSSGWFRGPANTNMRICTGKGSVVVVDALNGDNAVRWVMVSLRKGRGLSPEGRSSSRQANDTLSVIFRGSKGHGITGHALGNGID